MAGKGETIVIKKKKGGGHGGAHGGAWKVAYADFVTAMMCFFLVMWLMGSDEETRAAISHYFNHPNTPYKQGSDPYSHMVHALGEKEGSGEGIVNGLAGLWPEDLIERPKPEHLPLHEAKTLSQMIEDLLEGQIYGMDVTQDHIRFSLAEKVLFEPGSSVLTEDARKSLDTLGQILRSFKGYITIAGYTDEVPTKGGKYSTNWELSFGRALSVMRYLAKNHKIREDILVPVGGGTRKAVASNKEVGGRAKNRRVEFTLSYEQPE